ncbi:MAG: IS4 family transposase [Thermoplasmata archaeon]
MSHPSGKTRSSTRAQPVADRAQADDYLKAFLALFPPRVVQRIARESGFVRRHRKLDPVAFLYTLAFETGPQLQRTLDGLRDAYNKRTPDPILSTGGSYERFTPELVEFLRRCVAYGLAQLQVAPGNRLTPKLARFTDLLIQDSTVIRLFAALAKVYPPTRLAKNTRSKRTAGVKVATLFSARANGPARLELFPETTSEIDTLKVGTWVKGSVVLTDLGFYKHQGFARIEENGGFYLSRLKANANPLLLGSHLVHRGQAIELEGKRWSEVGPRLHREVLDAEVELSFQRRAYRGRHRGDTLRARLVAVWDEVHREYPTYVTNIPTEVLTAEEVAELYRCRWSVELLFKEAKGSFHLDRVATGNRYVAESLIWTSWLAMLVSRRGHSVLLEHLPAEERFRYPPLRWSRVFRDESRGFLTPLLQRLKKTRVVPDPIDEMVGRLDVRARDPNITRQRFREGWFG